MNASRIWVMGVLVALAAGVGVGVGCKNSKYCDNGANPCPSGMTCDLTVHACTGGAGGRAGAGGVGGGAGKGGNGGDRFRCDASAQCGEHDPAAPVCEIDAASCVGCVKDTDCKQPGSPICQNNKCVRCNATTECAAHDAGLPLCSLDSGACIECTTSTDCTADAKRPICDPLVGMCVRCTADSQCTAKSSTTGPGVCMFQVDGHCATDAETVYVQPSSTACVPGSTIGGGTSTTPLCHLEDGVSSIGNRDLIVLRGGSIPGGVTIQNATMLYIVGQNAAVGPNASATITVDSGQDGLHVIGGNVYVRRVEIVSISAMATIGIVVDTSATIRLDGVEIDNMPQGGLRVTGSAGYDVSNCIFAGNGGTMDEVGRFIGGAYLTMPPSGAPARFVFDTAVANKDRGVVCTSATQVIDASLLASNLGGGGMPDYSGCTLSPTSKAIGTADPMLTTAHRLTVNSSCVDFVTTPPANAPLHDIDGTTRPQGNAFDCGASEYMP